MEKAKEQNDEQENAQPAAMRAITSTPCPACGKDVYICNQIVMPTIEWTKTKEEVNSAREELKKMVDKIDFKSETYKKKVYDWINNPEVVFNKDEMDEYIDQIKQAQDDSQ